MLGFQPRVTIESPMRFILGLLLATPGVAWAQVVSSNPFPAILPGPISANLTPFVTIPADSADRPIARITGAVTDGLGRVFINDLTGTIYRTDLAGSTPAPYLDIKKQNVGAVPTSDFYQVGLTSIAFHPNFSGDPIQPGYGKFYTSSSVANTGTATLGNQTGPAVVQIREWTTATPAAPVFAGTSRPVLSISGYADGHSNGTIAFNPNARPGGTDYGNLYIGSGDGLYNDGNQTAQNLASPQGKMLRINPLAAGIAAYTVPADNPYAATTGALPEIYASGLRFPQSFSFDAGGTGQLFINDLGQAALEEVDLGQAGANYGWSQRAGTLATGYAQGVNNPGDEQVYATPTAPENFTDPIAEYWHDEGAALGSGFVYRGTAIPALFGKYVLADIVVGRLFYFDPAALTPGSLATLQELQLTLDGSPVNLYGKYYPRADARLAELPNHELLLLTKAAGQVYELGAVSVPEPASAAVLLSAIAMACAVRRPGSRAKRRC